MTGKLNWSRAGKETAAFRHGYLALKAERMDLFEVTCPRCGHTGTIRAEKIHAAKLHCRRCGWKGGC